MNYEDALKLAKKAAGLGEATDLARKIMSAREVYSFQLAAARLVLEFVPDDQLPDSRPTGLCVTCHGCGEPGCCIHDEECGDPSRVRDSIARDAVGSPPPRPEPPLMRVVYCPPEGRKT